MALGHPGEGVFGVSRVEHTPAGIDGLIARIAGYEPDPAEVRVVVETRHGMLVERLVDAGYVVVPVNPDLVARRRGPAEKKDDAEDARIACLIALDRLERLLRSSPTVRRQLSRGPSPGTTSERLGTSTGCSTACEQISSPPSRPRWPSPATTRTGPPSCASWSAGPAPTPRSAPRQRNWRPSPAARTTAGPSASPTEVAPPWRPITSSPGTTWCGPRPTPSA